MIVIREDRLNRYSETSQARHERRIQDIIDITDQEVMDRLGTEEPEDIEKDVLYRHFQHNSENLFAFTGFTQDEFEKIWDHVAEEFMTSKKGRKQKISPKDILLILLNYIRRYPRIEEQCAIFSLKPSTLENIIAKYIPLMAKALKQDLIDAVANQAPTYHQNFPECGYIVDATVQEINKPSLSFDVAKEYYSGKHDLYCLKSQLIVNVQGLAVFIASSIKGSIHDKLVFDQCLDDFKKILALHPQSPAKILADKGYQDNHSEVLVTPYKGNSATLTREQLTFNQKLGEVRIIVENFFGRLKSRYEIMEKRYRGSHEMYSDIFTICCALVNFEQIECNHPLRERDRHFYLRLLVELQRKQEEKRTMQAERRRQQAARRMRIYSRGPGVNSSDESA